jgi:hypothetical protein
MCIWGGAGKKDVVAARQKAKKMKAEALGALAA